MNVRDARLGEHGFELIPGLLGESWLGALRDVLVDGIPNQRGIFESYPLIAELAASRLIKDSVKQLIGCECSIVRGILFDKTENANWQACWHQDRVIAVETRRAEEGFTGWSEKGGVPHALAPVDLLESMVSVRVHLDDSPEENGALRVWAGSHCEGVLSEAGKLEMKQDRVEVICEAKAGDALLMKPLLLHSSLPVEKPHHRRVIHLECATSELPGELEWHWKL
ncbi:MAG: phytanoyl-CoA dioxygenase family protein [Limisphaerales bacterium]